MEAAVVWVKVQKYWIQLVVLSLQAYPVWEMLWHVKLVECPLKIPS